MTLSTEAQAWLDAGRPQRALAVLARAATVPEDAWAIAAQAWLCLGKSDHARAAIARAPASLCVALVSVSLLEHEGRYGDAAAALGALPDTPVVCLRRGSLAMTTGRYSEALAHFEQALRLRPGLVDGHVGRGLALDRLDRAVEAVDALQRWVAKAACPARLVRAWASIAVRDRPSQVVERVHRALAGAPAAEVGLLWHLIGDAHERLGEHRDAFVAHTHANRARAVPFDGPGFYAGAQALMQRTSRPLPVSDLRDQRPILIVGAPRSGTTLLETLLLRHRDLGSAGELQDARLLAVQTAQDAGVASWDQADLTSEVLTERGLAYLDALGRDGGVTPRVIDKTPGNGLLLGFIAAMVPGLTVVRCVRDPHDVAWSCFRQPFPPKLGWTTSLAGIGWWLRTERELMAHWQASQGVPVVEVRYEALVQDPQAAVDRVLRAAGVPSEAGSSAGVESRSDSATASWRAVREPVHGRSVGRSGPYRAWMGAL